MSKVFLGRAIFLRHGQTEYTDVFPDLTEQGMETIKRSARSIKPIAEEHQRISIVASPLARAQGSAAIIANELEYKGEIREEPAITAAILKKILQAKALFNEYMSNGGMRALAIAYGIDPRYENGQVIEPRSRIRKRFFEYFTNMIRSLVTTAQLPPCLIHVSHYEVLYHFVERLFELDYEKDEPLDYGEIIVISIFDIGIKNTVEIEVTFRKKTIKDISFRI